MAKDRTDAERKERKEKEKLEKKKLKNVEENGIKKSKSDKHEKKEKKRAAEKAEAAEESDDAHPAVDVDGDTAIAGTTDKEVVKELLVGASVPFANPMADDKTLKKVLKGVKKAAKHKTLRRGVQEVVKSLRKSPTDNPKVPFAVVVLAADISPLDVISHIPVLCEDHNVPYIYVPSRAALGAASSTKRPTSVVMVVAKPTKASQKKGEEDGEEWSETYADVAKVVQRAGRDVRI